MAGLHSPRLAGHAGLLERDTELDRLGELLKAAAGGGGRLVLVEGPAGIGKTTLLGAATELAEDHGFTVLQARGGPLERDFAWGVVRQLYEPMITGAQAARRKRLLAGAAAHAGSVLGVGDITVSDTPAGDRAFAVNHGLYWLTANLTDEQPLALLVDDAHWADSATLAFLNYLGRRLERLPLFVLVGFRGGEPGAPHELLEPLYDIDAAERLSPGPLSDSATATVIERELGSRPGEGLTQACRDATGGNPFLLGELVRGGGDGDQQRAARAARPRRAQAARQRPRRRADHV
jgi:hypothetical protein